MSDAASRPAGGCCRGPAADVPCGDPVVEAVVERLRSRSLRGRAKYGVGLDRSDLDLLAWLVHLQEELLDATGYIQSAIRVIGKEMEDRREKARPVDLKLPDYVPALHFDLVKKTLGQ